MTSCSVSRRFLLVSALAGAAAFGLTRAQAADKGKIPFTNEAFQKAQASGKPILVEVSAPWCPTCKAQKPILKDLTSFEPFDKVTIFEVDFDSQKDVLKTLRVAQQSTLIAFKGKAETGRSVGDTRAESIASLMKTAL